MDIVINVRGHVIIHHVGHPLDVQTTGGDICVELVEDGIVTLIMDGGAGMMEGSFTDIRAGRAADAYGTLSMDGVEGCFQASEVVVTVPST